MNKPDISIIIPGIRNSNWLNVFDSIVSSTKRTFEVIFCGPYLPDIDLACINTFKYIKDLGSPARASQIAAQSAEGKYLMWSADDALFLDDALDKNIDLLESMGNDIGNVVVAKYYEGINGTEKILQPDDYFKVKGSTWTHSPFVPEHYWLFNVAIMHRMWFETLGGWDCSFEGTFYTHTDLAIRAQSSNSIVKMSDYPLLNCDHNQSDHFPIENAQINNDKPLYFKKYGNPNWVMKERFIAMDNWKEIESVWKRFKK